MAIAGVVIYLTRTTPTSTHPAQPPTENYVETRNDMTSIPDQRIRPLQSISRLIQSNISHVSQKYSIVIFENGTSIFVESSSSDLIKSATDQLEKLKNAPLRFATHSVDQGDFITSFAGGAIYNWVFKNEADMISQQPIEQMKELLTEDELKAIPDRWSPSQPLRAGLLARLWLRKDLRDLKVIKVLKAAPQKHSAP